MARSRSLAFTFSAALLSLPLYASGQAVHSAAGALPNTSAPPTQEPRQFSSSNERRAPPPLPEAGANKPVSHAGSGTFGEKRQADPSGSPAAHSAPARPAFVTFKDSLDEKVTIDVMDMALTDLFEQLAPPGWRLRFQHVDDATKEKRVDLTANSTRGDVMHELLSRAGLSVEPFESFDTPLILVTSSQ